MQFVELIKACESKEIVFKDIIKRKYISIDEKYSIINLFFIKFSYRFLENFDDDVVNPIQISSEYDKRSLFEILFAYTDVVFESSDITSENYDKLFTLGIYDAIIKACGKDFLDFKSKIDRYSGIDAVPIIMEINKAFEKMPSARDFNESIDKIKSTLKDEEIGENLKYLSKVEVLNMKSFENALG